MLTSIRNGQMSKKNAIIIKKTKFCESVLRSLWDEGFILGYSNLQEPSCSRLKVFLKYSKTGSPAISRITPISRPGNRFYLCSRQLWKLETSQVFMLFSTDAGIQSLSVCKKMKIGGEPLFYVK